MFFQVIGEVAFRERADAVVLCLDPAVHALTPPVFDNRLRYFRARAIEAVKRAAREVTIKLAAILRERFAQSVKHFHCKAAGIFAVRSIIGGTAPISTALATRP